MLQNPEGPMNSNYRLSHHNNNVLESHYPRYTPCLKIGNSLTFYRVSDVLVVTDTGLQRDSVKFVGQLTKQKKKEKEPLVLRTYSDRNENK